MRSEINRNEIDRNETKRYNTKRNKAYFNEAISWGKTRQKLNEKNRESIVHCFPGYIKKNRSSSSNNEMIDSLIVDC